MFFMKIEVNVKKNYFVLLFSISIILVGVLTIGALTVGEAPNPGHLISDISPINGCMTNGFLKWSGTNWICELIEGSGWMPGSFNTESPGLANLGVVSLAPFRGGTDAQGGMCVLLDTGQVKCAGSNGYGQLGTGDFDAKNEFQLVVDLNNVTKLVNTGRLSTCAIVGTGDDAKIKCWGYNYYGQLGIGSYTNANYPQFVIKEDGNVLTGVVDVMGMYENYAFEYVCALTNEATGNLYCWGYNGYGQLGIGSTEQKNKAQKVTTFNSLSVKNISTGGYASGGFACAIAGEARDLYCWGYNGYGQLGVGDAVSRSVPTKISLITNVQSVEAGHDDYGSTCAIVGGNNEVYCWGYNGYGQVGVGDTTAKYSPQKTELSNIRKLNSIGSWTCSTWCALGFNEELYCWGYNGYGQVGVGSTTSNIYSPVKVMGDVEDIGGWGFSYDPYYSVGTNCAIKTDGSVYCWGYNGHGGVAQGSTGAGYYTLPQEVIGLEGKVITKIACGGHGYQGEFCSALLSDKSVKVWGYNAYGQLGTGDGLTKYVATSPK